MSSREHLKKIAQVLKSNGSDGELLMGFREIGPKDIDISEPVFIHFDGLPVPYFFESFSKRGLNKAIVRITGVNNLKDAEELVGKSVYADAEATGTDDEISIMDVIQDWEVVDENGNAAGIIKDFHDFGGNTCLEIITDRGEKLIPFHEDLVISFDEEHRILKMEIPEGL